MGWAIAAALLLTALFVRRLHAPLDGDFQGWGSASCMTMARAFNQLGALHTHFVPFQNNLPIGTDPDVYLHWPPLYPLVLALFLRVLGDHASSGRVLALLICLTSGTLVMVLARRLYGLRAGLLAAFFFFNVRATWEGASPLLQQPLSVMLALAAVFCFLHATPLTNDAAQRVRRAFAAAGLLAISLSILTAWDTVFVAFGLLGTAMWMHRRAATRLGVLYCAATVLTFAAVEAAYIASYPRLFANQFATIAYRAGVHFNGGSSLRLHTIVDSVHYDLQYGLVAGYWRALRFVDMYFSDVTLLACCMFVALWMRARRQDSVDARASAWLVGALLVPALVWFALMRNYVAIHPFPLVLVAPFVAIASGVLLDRLWAQFAAERPMRWALEFALPLIVMLPLLIQFRDAKQWPAQEFADFSPLVAQNTPPAAVVLTPVRSLVPTYDTRRHLVRGIETPALLAQATAMAHRDFPGAPLYFALRDADAAAFGSDLGALPAPVRRGDSAIYRLPE